MAINIFISYYGKFDFAKKNSLKNIIKKTKGLNPLVVEDVDQNNSNFGEKVMKYIDDSMYVIPIISAESYQASQWLNQEIGYSFAKKDKSKIIAIVDDRLLNRNGDEALKGFLHAGQMELAYRYTFAESNETQTLDSFEIQAKKLIKDILNIENIDKLTGQQFKVFNTKTYAAYDEKISESIQNYSEIIVRVKLTNKSQRFRFYINIKNNKNYSIWMGFTNFGDLNNEKYYNPIPDKNNDPEFTEIISNDNKLEFYFKIPIKNRIKNMLPMYSEKLGIDLDDSFQNISVIRFRGDLKINENIEYGYYFNVNDKLS